MINYQVIDGFPKALIEEVLAGMGTTEGRRALRPKLRSLLNAPNCSACGDTGKMQEPGQEPGSCGVCRSDPLLHEPAANPQGEPIIAGSVLDSYDYAIADLDPESACPYVSNGELSQLVAAVRTLQARYLTQPKDEPDPILCGFYEVSGYPGLVRELVGHVAQLQDSAKRNVKPWEDTFPPTLLPAYVERVNAANAALPHASSLQGEPSHWADPAGNTITAELKAHNVKLGGAPAAAVSRYTDALFRHPKAAPGEPAAPVLGGWKLVPINPTVEMLKAVDDEATDKHLARGRAISAWGLMLSAAPLPSIMDLHYDVAHAVECELPARGMVGGLHFPAPAYAVAAVASAGGVSLLEPAEPILVEAVAVTRMCPEDGLWLDWLLEGGIAALEHPGTVLLVAQGVLTNDSGNGYVYRARNPEDDA